jgi:hypothetical protein
MKSIKVIVLKPYFLIFSFVCIFLLLSSFKLGAFNTGASKKQVNFPVNSLVRGLTIVDIEIQKHFAVVTLKNDSNRVITAFALSSSGIILRSEMIGSDKAMASATTTTKLCDLPSSTSPEEGIIILAVVYEDGTSEGDAKFVKQIFDARAGTQLQLTRILPLFRDASVTPKTMSLTQKREAMKLKLEQLPEEEEGQSLEFRVGLHDEKERAMNNLKELERIEQERGEDITRQILPIMVNTYEKRNLAILNSFKQAR